VKKKKDSPLGQMMQDARSRAARSPHENLHPADSSVSGEEFLQD